MSDKPLFDLAPTELPEPTRRRARYLYFVKLAIVVLAVLLVVKLAQRVEWLELKDRLASLHRPLFAAAIVAMLGRFGSWQLRWSMALRAADIPHRPSRAFLSLMASLLVNLLTPSIRVVGGFVRARFVAGREVAKFSTRYGTVLFDQLLHHLVFATFTWLSLAAGWWYIGRVWLSIAALITLIVLAAGIVVWQRQRSPEHRFAVSDLIARLAERRGPKLKALIEGGTEAVAIVPRLARTRGLLARAAGASVTVFVCNALAMWLILRAVGAPTHGLIVAATLGLGIGAGLVLGTPGGAGTTEAAMIGCLVAFGVEQTDALAATLLYRGVHYALVLIIGLPALGGFLLQRRQRRR